MLPDMNSLNGAVHFSDVKICSYPLLVTQKCISEYQSPLNNLFIEAAIILKLEKPLEVATFSEKHFFLEHLIL